MATPSPYFVQLQREEELGLAKKAMRNTDLGVIEPLVCRPCRGSWGCTNEDPAGDAVDLVGEISRRHATGNRCETMKWTDLQSDAS